jgi:hypothetical protein
MSMSLFLIVLKKPTSYKMQLRGAFTVTVKTTSGTGPTFAATDKTNKLVYSDGTDIVEYSNNLSGVASNGFAVAMAIAL